MAGLPWDLCGRFTADKVQRKMIELLGEQSELSYQGTMQ